MIKGILLLIVVGYVVELTRIIGNYARIIQEELDDGKK